ncbi:hypothetical protein FIM10_04015 [Sphingomonadales bacterium 56]|uniref:hypothetical protein n=1 Tax=unclassified Sphingobium TaxID=2611147 RepID=UPI00191B4DCD|nr:MULTISPECIES: hypothetical protein [unclassified Sphingobium]MBY2927841.1 hypothetical protein [Sphingomonadales bacterium 56]MBY2957941.1 hypothetical protein [Sphingomonadales bacterium 58]CAD7336046.1 hypothetical protein SPHS6_00814 [Sphingobium sp. S6]CAD7336109.1 hypothetical protein SPHS8_00854 [Sphingobium sp. S8]
MSSILLPSSPAVRSARPMVQSFGSILRPFLGGPSQRINRLGTRWALQVSMPLMRAEVARTWTSALSRGSEDGVIMPIPQDIAIGNPGAPKVSAAVSAGTALPLKGLTAAYAVRAGQFLSIIRGGRRHVHIFSADAVASGSGTMTAAIWPMLRVALATDDVVEIAAPKIEGWLDASFEWDVLLGPWVQLPDFTISEAA